MSWTPKALNDLPLIVCGPILRKVTPDEVNVFVVFKQYRKVKLQVYNTGGSVVKHSGSAYVDPVQLSPDLYVLNITANVGSALTPGTTYAYNLFFNQGSTLENLNSMDVLVKGSAGTGSITYDASPVINTVDFNCKLPTFVIPPPGIDDLWILHGSCRKPHGQGFDAMDGVSEIIESAIESATPNIRPQMLCLTGDQIYADDVADSMLHMIIRYLEGTFFTSITTDEISDYTLNYLKTTFASDIEKDLKKKYGKKYMPPGFTVAGMSTTDLLAPGQRRPLITKICNFFSYENEHKDVADPCKSHLVRFKEFVLMYIMVWSDVLWPTALPQWDDFKYLYQSSGNSLIPKKISSSVKQKTQAPIVGSTHDKTIVVDADSKYFEGFTNENTRLERFRDVLPQVRKALAHISTYMILDDHEITDDLFFNINWYNTMDVSIGGNLQYGKKLLTNGLLAYTLMQGWGNTPDRFASGVGATLLSEIPGYPATTYASIHSKLYPGSQTGITIPNTSFSSFSETYTNSTQVNFDFVLTHNTWNYELLFLDTRRERASILGTGKLRPPAVLSYNAIRKQINNTGIVKKDLSIVVNASPFLENKVMTKGRMTAKGIPDIIAENDELTVDQEEWLNEEKPITYYDFLYQILGRGKTNTGGQLEHRVLILGGDVHYSFTKSLELKVYSPFLDHTTMPYNSKLKMVSLCASSFKNQVDDTISGTRVAHGDVWPKSYPFLSPTAPSHNDFENEYIFGWNTTNETKQDYVMQYSNLTNKKTRTLSTIPAVVDITPFYTTGGLYSSILTTPSKDFEGELKIHESARANVSQTITPGATGLSKRSEVMLLHKKYALQDDMTKGRTRVGKNNFGEILFNWQSGTKKVFHNLWWRDNSWDDIHSSTMNIKPLTNHKPVIDFEL